MASTIEILNCSLEDLNFVELLYDAARLLQTQRKMVVWPVFERSLLERDILENRLWKLNMDNKVACVWTITFSDKEIWGELDQDNSIFLHRIATNPEMRGNRFVDHIVKWARKYAVSLGREFVRLDTLGDNAKLIEHYTSAGFTYLGISKVTNLENLPEHYHREPRCLRFEMKITN